MYDFSLSRVEGPCAVSPGVSSEGDSWEAVEIGDVEALFDSQAFILVVRNTIEHVPMTSLANGPIRN